MNTCIQCGKTLTIHQEKFCSPKCVGRNKENPTSKEMEKLHGTILLLEKKIKKLQGELLVEKEKTATIATRCEDYESKITELYGQNVELREWLDDLVQSVEKYKRGMV